MNTALHRAKRNTFIVLALAAFCQPTAHAVMSDLSATGIRDFLNANKNIDTADKFLGELPAAFKNDWIMMTDSESAQTGNATSPRLLLPNPDASKVFGFALDTQLIEYLEFDSATNKFRFHSIVMNGGGNGGTVTVDDASCLRCHASRRAGVRGTGPRPNWDAYDSWGGMLPFNRDRIYEKVTVSGTDEESAEAAAVKRIFKDLKDNPLIKQLQLPNGITQDATTGDVSIAFTPCDAGIAGAEPCKTDSGTGPVNVKFAVNANLVSYPGDQGPIAVTQGGKYLRLQATSKGANTDEGRGVALFDNFTATNARRVAQELADFPVNPVDVRYVALAITKGCVAAKTLGKYAPKEALDKLLAFQTGLDAAVKTFPDLLADTRKRMESLPMLKANLQAGNLKGLIEANGGTASPERVTANIARRSKTNPAETFNLDKNTGFMIDREFYDAATRPPRSDEETLKMALYRLYLEPLGVAVDTWSMSVKTGTTSGRHRTYTFGDLFRAEYAPQIRANLETALGVAATATCSDLAGNSIKQYVKGF